MSILSSRTAKSLALLPFGYFTVSRLTRWTDVFYLVAMSWIPAIWILSQTIPGGLRASLISFALGYLAFISIYEIGYLANDRLGPKREVGGRSRTPFDTGTLYVLFFVAARATAWMLVGVETGWLRNPGWVASAGALIAVISLHNLVTAGWLRTATFLQLALLRFMMPIIAVLPFRAYFEVFSAIFLLYASIRLLSYMDSKGLLDMPQRKEPTFGLLFTFAVSPLILLLALLADSTLLVELLVYFLLVHGSWTAINGLFYIARPSET